MIKHLIFSLLVLLAPCSRSYAYFDRDPKTLTMLNGMADNTVNSITKDKDGFMWFGTNNGLSRYDGKTIVNFSDPERYLKVTSIRQTSNKFLWFLAENRLYVFDKHREKIHPVSEGERPVFNVNDFTTDSDSVLWLIKGGKLIKAGLHRNREGDAFETVEIRNSMQVSLGEEVKGECRHLCDIPGDRLAVVTRGGELVFIDKNKSEACGVARWKKGVSLDPAHMMYDEGEIWISTIRSGALRYSLESGIFEQYTYNKEADATFSHKDVYGMCPLQNGKLVACTWNGITLLTPGPENGPYSTSIHPDAWSKNKELESRTLCAFFDPLQETLWLGTNGGGVLEINLKEEFYGKIRQESHNEIWNIDTDGDGYLWLSTFHDGILKSKEPFDSGKEMELTSINNMLSTKGYIYRCLVKDSEGNFWFGGDKGSLVKYNPQNEKIRTYSLPLLSGEEARTTITSLFIDSWGVLWIGTSYGLFGFDATRQSQPQRVNASRNNIDPLFFRCIAEDGERNMWFGTHMGLKKYVKGDLIDYEPLNGADIRSLLSSKDGKLYIGTQKGLYVHDLPGDSLSAIYTTRNGLCNNFIGCLTEDAKGRLWIGSNSGISKFNKEQSVFYHYYISGNNRTAFFVDSLLFVGNNKSVTYFNPYKTGNQRHMKSNVYLTQLDVNNEEVRVNQKINGQVILSEGITYAPEIKLNHKNNKFALHFSNLSFSEGFNKYYYRLYPYEKSWLVAEENEKVSYSLLPPGKYRFEVRPLLQDGSMGEARTLDVKILPHWSRTGWFYFFCLLMVSAILLYLRQWIMAKQKRKEQARALDQELKRVKYERAKEKQLNEERVNFFVNVSHELRTPLTLIMAPLSELLKEFGPEEKTQGRLRLIQEHALLLQTTVNELLYLQKSNTSLISLNLTRQDMGDVVKRVVQSFAELITLNRLQVQVETERIEFMFDLPKMESVIRNLISNAIKYTPRGGEIRIKVTARETEDKPNCTIVIADNGPGIPREYQHRIFESFVTTVNRSAHSNSLGLGLKIVKNNIDLHGGNVQLESDGEHGSRFTLTIPLEPAANTLSLAERHSRSEVATLPAAETEGKQTPAPKRSSGRKVLIVEDNSRIRSYIGSLFEDQYQLLYAANGAEGVEIALADKPDLIISDIMMPVKDGLTCCRELKENMQTAHIPIVLLTAKTEEVDLLEGMKCGADDYLMKPFNPEVLKLKAENLIRTRDQLKRLYTKAVIRPSRQDKKEEEAAAGDTAIGKSEFMQQTINLIEKNLTNPDFNVKMLAQQLNMSQPTLYRKIKSESDLSISEVIRSVRMSKSAVLLLGKKHSIQEVAEMVGFNDQATFRKHFMDQFGVQPSKYTADL